jgi:hypothetical protein
MSLTCDSRNVPAIAKESRWIVLKKKTNDELLRSFRVKKTLFVP